MSEQRRCLHIIGSSPSVSTGFQECLRFLDKNDAILLTGSGVNAVLALTKDDDLPDNPIFALQADLSARGIGRQANFSTVRAIADDEFVQLVVDYPTSQTWC